jgi:protoheme IX farnesyltransferase
VPDSSPIPTPTIAAATAAWVRDLGELIKIRLTTLVLATTLAGFYLGRGPETPGLCALAVLVGTGLVAAGASAFNQLLETRADARMRRTRHRPLPSGRMDERDALFIGALCSGTGLVVLALTCHFLSALLAALTLTLYIGLYTPLKRISSLNTLIGAIPGALPPVIGYAAASGRIDALAAVLFAILFLWQMPHFLAIAWLYRDDYAAGGFRMLTLHDPTGHATGIKSFLYALLLLPTTTLPALAGLTGWIATAVCLLASGTYTWTALSMARHPSPRSAKTLFLASLAYLPVVLLSLVLDRALS